MWKHDGDNNVLWSFTVRHPKEVAVLFSIRAQALDACYNNHE